MSQTQPQLNRSRWRNQTQTTSIAVGGFIFLSAGINMAVSVGWNSGSFIGSLEHFRYSWFVGVIIGAVLVPQLIHSIPKQYIMGFSSLLIFINGVIFASVPREYNALLAGRYLNGIGVGLATVAYFVHASEIAVNSYRGSCLAVEQFSVSFGVAIQMIYSSQWGSVDFPANRLHGILDIVIAAAALVSLPCFIESPIYFLRKGDEAAALDSLSRLQRPQGVTSETTALLEELKNYICEYETYNLTDNILAGLVPLLKMIFFRSMMVAFCFSLPLNNALMYSLFINNITWPPALAACLRIIGALVAVVVVDGLARKLPSLIFMLILGSLILAIAIILHSAFNLIDSHYMSIVTSLSLLTQFFAGLFVPFTSIGMGEAFPLVSKPYFISVCVIVEQAIHIIIICTFDSFVRSVYDCLFAQGIMIIVTFLLLCVSIPETRKTSLKEAQIRYRCFLNLKMY